MQNLRLSIENVGAINKANINLSGLCVIAGKNDTGKSTVGKLIMAIIKAQGMSSKKSKDEIQYFNRMLDLLFNNQISFSQGSSSIIELKKDDNILCSITIQDNNCSKFNNYEQKTRTFLDCTLLQTPFVWDLYDFFHSIMTLEIERKFYRETNSDEERNEINISYPYILWDVYKKLVVVRKHRNTTSQISDDIKNIIKGEFIKEENKEFAFHRAVNSQILKISLENVAVGIKQLGILQTLLKNNYITEEGFFIFDEPENHLHPSWQIEFAKIMIRLSKENIPILITTHSPYMLEALHKYGKQEKVAVNFHLANNGEIRQIGDNMKSLNERTLNEIFHILNTSSSILDEIE